MCSLTIKCVLLLLNVFSFVTAVRGRCAHLHTRTHTHAQQMQHDTHCQHTYCWYSCTHAPARPPAHIDNQYTHTNTQKTHPEALLIEVQCAVGIGGANGFLAYDFAGPLSERRDALEIERERERKSVCVCLRGRESVCVFCRPA